MRRSKECDLLQFLDSDTTRKLLNVFVQNLLDVFLYKSQGPYHHWYCCGFHSPHSFNLDSRSLYLDSICITFAEVYLSVGMAISMSRPWAFFLEFTTYPAHWVCAIFEDFVQVIVGLDGLVLDSNDKTLCFRLEPSYFEPLDCHLLVYY